MGRSVAGPPPAGMPPVTRQTSNTVLGQRVAPMYRQRVWLPICVAALLFAPFGCLQKLHGFSRRQQTRSDCFVSCASPGRSPLRTSLRAAGLGDWMGAMQKMTEGAKKLPELQAKLRTMPSTGTALGGRVQVVVSGDLAPLSVDIDQSVLDEGLPAKVISDAVLLAFQEAHKGSLELTRSKLAEFYADLGVPMPPQPGAGAAAAPGAAPAVPPPQKENEPLPFDPIGLRTLD